MTGLAIAVHPARRVGPSPRRRGNESSARNHRARTLYRLAPPVFTTFQGAAPPSPLAMTAPAPNPLASRARPGYRLSRVIWA